LISVKASFFKTGPGDYAEHDQFLGVSVPQLMKLAKSYSLLSMDEVVDLLQSPFNEERLFALLMMIERFQKGDGPSQKMIYGLYQTHVKHVNNWNLVGALYWH
jgi:3-methyladenine DNA glycosylase AlkD